MLRITAVVMAVAVATAGCRSNSNEASGTDYSTKDIARAAVREGVVSRSLAGTMRLESTGALVTSWTRETPLRVVTSVGLGIPSDGWLLSVGLDLPIEAPGMPETTYLRPAFDLFGYHGKGQYAVERNSGGPSQEEIDKARKEGKPTTTGAGRSDSFVVVRRGDVITTFNDPVRPCTINVEDKGHEGEMHCPELSNGKESIALTWSWKADPTRVLEDNANTTLPANGSTSTTQAPTSPTGQGPSTTATAESATQATASTDSVPKKVFQSDVPININVDPECAKRGQVVAVYVDSDLVNAAVTLVPSFADGNSRGLYGIGRTDTEGSFRWTFAVPPDVPYGSASMMVSVSSEDAEHGGGGYVPFEVKQKC